MFGYVSALYYVLKFSIILLHTTYDSLELFGLTVPDTIWCKQPKLLQLYIEFINHYSNLILFCYRVCA
jgi:hypothetical protein